MTAPQPPTPEQRAEWRKLAEQARDLAMQHDEDRHQPDYELSDACDKLAEAVLKLDASVTWHKDRTGNLEEAMEDVIAARDEARAELHAIDRTEERGRLRFLHFVELGVRRRMRFKAAIRRLGAWKKQRRGDLARSASRQFQQGREIAALRTALKAADAYIKANETDYSERGDCNEGTCKVCNALAAFAAAYAKVPEERATSANSCRCQCCERMWTMLADCISMHFEVDADGVYLLAAGVREHGTEVEGTFVTGRTHEEAIEKLWDWFDAEKEQT